MYVPYIAKNMLDANDTTYFNVSGMHIYDPLITDYMVATTIPARAFVDYWEPVFPFNGMWAFSSCPCLLPLIRNRIRHDSGPAEQHVGDLRLRRLP